MNLLKSTGTFGFYTIISRLLGYLRDILIAIFLGTGLLSDAFFVAFRIPNTFRRLFSEGTFNAAFVPSYAAEMVKTRYYPLVMHLGFGVVMGWLLSLNLFYETNRFKRRFMLIISLAIPVIYHGTYNYYSAVDIFPLLTVILIISIVYWARREQLRKITESEEKYKIMNSDVAYTYLASLFLVVAVLISAMIY